MMQGRIVGILLIVIGAGLMFLDGYMLGSRHAKESYKAEQASALAAQIKEREAFEAKASKIETKYVERLKVIYRSAENENVEAVNGLGCVIPNGFVRLHDNAAIATAVPQAPSLLDGSPSGVKLSDVSRSVAGNYRQCNEQAAQLNALIDFVQAQER